MNKPFLLLLLAFITLTAPPSSAQKKLKAKRLSKYHIPAANYSGITHLWADDYAVVDDKSPSDGYYRFTILQHPHKGKILSVKATPLLSDGNNRKADCEDIAYHPSDSTLFLTSEADHQIRQYSLQGIRTGKSLMHPSYFSPDNIEENGSFEALAYDSLTHLFWTTTETPLLSDRNTTPLMMRLQSYGEQLQPLHWYPYQMDPPELKAGKYYAHGIPAILPWGDGRLIIMERELTVPASYLGSKCRIKLYLTTPSYAGNEKGESPKQLLVSFTTHIKPFRLNYANYEGITWGRTLSDGRRTLLLISDSQARAGNALFHLGDYLKVIVLP